MYLSHKVILWCPSILHQCLSPFVYMLWSNFILGLNYLFFCFKLIIIHYHTQKQKKRKFKPMIKLNYNIYNIIKQQFVVTYWETNSQNFVLLPISSQEVE